jgi:hypothetical protein
LRLRGWLLLLVFAHVMLHPWVHAMGMGKTRPAAIQVSNASSSSRAAVTSGDDCELCRVGHNATVTPRLPKTDLLNPTWIHTDLLAVNYASLQADRRIPSRAPPTL